MPEANTVKGIVESHPELGGPPSDPPSHTVNIPYWDRFNNGVDPVGHADNTSRRYFVETGPAWNDVEERIAPEPEEEGEGEE